MPGKSLNLERLTVGTLNITNRINQNGENKYLWGADPFDNHGIKTKDHIGIIVGKNDTLTDANEMREFDKNYQTMCADLMINETLQIGIDTRNRAIDGQFKPTKSNTINTDIDAQPGHIIFTKGPGGHYGFFGYQQNKNGNWGWLNFGDASSNITGNVWNYKNSEGINHATTWVEDVRIGIDVSNNVPEHPLSIGNFGINCTQNLGTELIQNAKFISDTMYKTLNKGYASMIRLGGGNAPKESYADSYISFHISDISGVEGNVKKKLDKFNTANMIINQFGNVGIGTSSPVERLDISGNVNIVGNTKISNKLDVSGIDVSNNLLVKGDFITNRIMHNLYWDSSDANYKSIDISNGSMIQFQNRQKTGEEIIISITYPDGTGGDVSMNNIMIIDKSSVNIYKNNKGNPPVNPGTGKSALNIFGNLSLDGYLIIGASGENIENGYLHQTQNGLEWKDIDGVSAFLQLEDIDGYDNKKNIVFKETGVRDISSVQFFVSDRVKIKKITPLAAYGASFEVEGDTFLNGNITLGSTNVDDTITFTGKAASALDMNNNNVQNIKNLDVSGTATFNGNVTIAADKNISMSSGSGTFTSGTGAIALNGDVTIAADKDILMQGTGTFTSGTGAIALNGDVTIAADKDILMQGDSTFTSGSGAIALNGDVTIASGKDILMQGSSTFTSGSGDVTLAGDVTIDSDKTFTTGTGAVALNGDVTIASGKDILMQGDSTFTSGSGAIALNGDVTIAADKDILMQGTGTFTSGTGAIALNGDVTIAADKDILMQGDSTFTSGSGAIALNGDVTIASGKDILMQGSSTFTSGSGDVTLAGDVTIDSDKTFTTGTGAVALNGDVTIASGKDILMQGDSTFTSGSGAIALNGDVTIASGKDILMQGTGTFTSGTGAIALNGDVTIAADKDILMQGDSTFTSGSGAIALNGDVTIASGKDILMQGSSTFTSGSGDVTLAGDVTIDSDKTFTTGTGAVALNGDVTIASGKDILMQGDSTFTSGSGAIALNGDVTIASGKDILMQGASTFTSGSGDVALNGNTTISGSKTFTTGTGNVSLNGDVTINSNKTFTTGTGAVSLNGNVTLGSHANDTITFKGKANSALDMNNNNIITTGDISCATITLGSRNLEHASDHQHLNGASSNNNSPGKAVIINPDGDVTIRNNLISGLDSKCNNAFRSCVALGRQNYTGGTGARASFAIGCQNVVEDDDGANNFPWGCGAIGYGAFANENIRFAIGTLTAADLNNTSYNMDHRHNETTNNNKFEINSAGDVIIKQALNVNGNTTISGSKTFTTGTGNVALNGDVTIASGKDILMQGASTFTSGSGDVALNGNTTISGSKTFTTGTGAVALNGDVTLGDSASAAITFKGKANSALDMNNNNIITTGKVGIGTDSPEDSLTIGKGGGGSEATDPRSQTSMSILSHNESSDAVLYFGTQHDLAGAKKTAIIAEGNPGWSRAKLHFCLNNSSGGTTNNSQNHAKLADSVMTIQPDGRVGIGITSPEAGLHVTTKVATDPGQVRYLTKLASDPGTGIAEPSGRPVAIKTESGDIWIGGAEGAFMVSSDKRIKENIVEVNDDKALQKVRDISCCWYNYKDKVKKGDERALGFIAQQVKEHLPEAINIQKSIIPDEMKKIHTTWNDTKMSSNDLQDVSGIKYRFYVSNDISDNEKMVELVGDENNCFTFKEKWENVFCYGKEVDDFHTLDKQKLFALNFSATQEIDKIQQEEKTKLEAAEAKIVALEAENTKLKTRLDAIESRLAALESV